MGNFHHETSNCLIFFLHLNCAHSCTFNFNRKCDHSWGDELYRNQSGILTFQRDLVPIPVLGNDIFFPVMVLHMLEVILDYGPPHAFGALLMSEE